MEKLGEFTEHCGCGSCGPVTRVVLGITTKAKQALVIVYGAALEPEANELSSFLERMPCGYLNEDAVEVLENMADVLILTDENIGSELEFALNPGYGDWATSDAEIEVLRTRVAEFIFK